MKKILLVIFVFLFFACPSFAENFYIKNYNIDVQVSKDNVYRINEQIDVYFTSPSHGIFRTIPIKNTVRRSDGSKYVNSAKIKNFKATDLVSKDIVGNSIKYKMGDPNRKITGSKTYRIQYDYVLSPDAIKENEFYFNLIGTQWDTHIKRVVFKISMPKKFDQNALGFSMGRYGQAGLSRKLFFESDGYQIKGYTLSPLFAKEALTVRIALPENYFEKRIDKNMQYCILLSVLLAVICVIFWFLNGKDDPVIPVVSFRPPKGINSAQMAAIYKNNIDADCTSSLILYLASKGYLKIEGQNGLYFLTRLKNYDGKDFMIKALFQELFLNEVEGTVPMYRIETSQSFQMALFAFEESLHKFKRKIYDQNSISFKNFIVPLICSIGILATFLFASNDYSLEFIPRCNFILLFPIIALIIFCSHVFSPKIPISAKGFLTLWSSLFGGIPAIILVTSYGVFSTFFNTDSLISFLCLIISIICTVNMPKKNLKGRRLLGEIIGFKKFIETVEKHRLEMLTQQNPDYIHKILPYAYALGVDGIWMDKISEMVNISVPSWYSGSYDRNAFLAYRNSVNNAIMSSKNLGMSTGSGYRGGRSSRGGGGFSGGGSGGGGGGSW